MNHWIGVVSRSHALPVIIEPVARSPALKTGLEEEKSMNSSV